MSADADGAALIFVSAVFFASRRTRIAVERFFSLSWYNFITMTLEAALPPNLCYNGAAIE
jgi:hypothetical protein